MELSRRGFLGSLLTVAIVVGLPTTVFPYEVKHAKATEMLTKAYNNYVKGSGGKFPVVFRISPELFEALEDEFESFQRYVEASSGKPIFTNLRFKSAIVTINPQLKGWNYTIA